MEMQHHMEALRVASESLYERYKDEARILGELHERQRVLHEEEKRDELMASIRPLIKHAIQTDATKAAFILVTASWVEGIANILLSLKLDVDQFTAVDALSPLEKWTVVIPLIVDKFQIPKDGKVHQALKELTYDRNALTHSKPKAQKDNSMLHKGKSPKYSVGQLDRVGKKMQLWVSLPRTLIQMVRESDETLGGAVWLHSGYWLEELQAEPSTVREKGRRD